MLETWIAFIQAITISDWVVIFLTTKPVFIFVTLAGLVWTRRGGRPEPKALPGYDAPLLESEST